MYKKGKVKTMQQYKLSNKARKIKTADTIVSNLIEDGLYRKHWNELVPADIVFDDEYEKLVNRYDEIVHLFGIIMLNHADYGMKAYDIYTGQRHDVLIDVRTDN